MLWKENKNKQKVANVEKSRIFYENGFNQEKLPIEKKTVG